MKEPGDREGRPYISCGNIGSGNVGATLAVARFMNNSQASGNLIITASVDPDVKATMGAKN